jgi:hypothetical protein
MRPLLMEHVDRAARAYQQQSAQHTTTRVEEPTSTGRMKT